LILMGRRGRLSGLALAHGDRPELCRPVSVIGGRPASLSPVQPWRHTIAFSDSCGTRPSVVHEPDPGETRH
jgi:hypothetical protein